MIHLHAHTRFSLSDGMATSDELAQSAGSGSVLAITDHNTMAGVVQHQKSCNAYDVKPIFGVESDLSDGTRLTLLAENRTGYDNLVHLTSAEVSWDRLDRYSDGVIAMSGDLKGALPQAILNQDNERLKQIYTRLDRIFGDRLYFEHIDHGLQEQATVNDHLDRIGSLTDTPVVRTNDVHFVSEQDARAQAVLICDRLGKSLNIDRIDCLKEAYLKDMACPVAAEIADRCDVSLNVDADPILPNFDTQDDRTQKEYLLEEARHGLQERLDGPIPDQYEQRLRHEWEIVCDMHYEGYYLIVADFIEAARDRNIPVGPGRGSGAGSLLAYGMGITNLDPIKYDLLFERFLNPERVSMPDFDIDFGQARRDEVIEWVRSKYGAECVAGISTYGELKPRSAWKSAARVFGVNANRANQLSKRHLPEGNAGVALSECQDELDDLYQEGDRYEDIIDYAAQIEGCYRNAGQHAAGVVIAEQPIWKHSPIKPPESDDPILDQLVELNMDDVEDIGLVKFDFLGLAELSVMRVCRELSSASIPDPIPLDDPSTFDLMSSGNTLGTFQLGSPGFQDMMARIEPDRFGDVIDAVALYRPGPKESGMVDTYIDRKHGRESVTYPHPDLEDILSDTRGIMIYQEQVMQMAQKIAGFSLGEADILRRAMSKKKVRVMKRLKPDFIQGAEENGYTADLAQELWDLTREFAAYGFNRSHSACYGKISYETAYMKTHHTAAYLAAQMSVRREDFDAVAAFAANAREMGIDVIEPSAQESPAEFEAEPGKIWVGLKSIKGLNAETAEEVARHAPYQGVEHFLDEIRPGKADMEALCQTGALDAVADVDTLDGACQVRANVLEHGQAFVEALNDYHESSQVVLFSGTQAGVDLGEAEPKDPYVCLAEEHELLGRFRRWHPVRMARRELQENLVPLSEWRGHPKMRALCLIENVRDLVDKNGNKMAFLTISDGETQIDVTVFSRAYDPEKLDQTKPVILKLEHDRHEGDLGMVYRGLEYPWTN